MHVGWVVDLRPAGGRLAPALPGALRAPRRRASRTPRAGGASSRRCRSGSPSRPGPTTPTSTPPSTSCTRAARTSTRSSTRSSPSRSRATARCGRSGSPTSSRTASSLIGKAHHCMVDGIAIVELGKLLLDAEPYEERPEAEAWEPAPVPSSRERFVARGRRPRRRRRRDRARAGQARELAAARLRGVPGLARTLQHTLLPPAPGGSALNRAGSPRRHHVRTSRPLDELRDDPAALRRHAQRRRARRLRGRAAALRRARSGSRSWSPPTCAAPATPRTATASRSCSSSCRATSRIRSRACTRSTPRPRSAPTAARPRTSTARSARSRSPRRRSSTCSPTRSRTRACRT